VSGDVLGADDANIYQYSSKNGSLVWEWKPPVQIATIWCTPCVTSDVIYAGAGHRLYAISRRTHEILWMFETEADITTVRVMGDTVLTRSGDGYMYALRTSDGDPRWASKLMQPDYAGDRCPFLVSDGLALVPTKTGLLFALDVTNGAPLWMVELGSRCEGAPIVLGTRIFVVGDETLYCLETQPQTEKPQQQQQQPSSKTVAKPNVKMDPNPVESPPAVAPPVTKTESPKETSQRDEKAAANKLRLAKKSLEDKKLIDFGKKLLRDTIKDYPTTEAASEAKSILKQLGD
jgi:hypothetical protein